MKIFKQTQGEGQTTTTTSEINVDAIAGTMTKYISLCLVSFNSDVWIIDTGVSEHMWFDKISLHNLLSLPCHVHINLPNSNRVTVTHIGNIHILPTLILNNVLLVPSFKYNLLFVHRLCLQFNCTIYFNSDKCLM